MRNYVTFAVVALGAVCIGLPAVMGQDSQRGERVLPAKQGSIDSPVRRHSKASWYELSNLRKDGPFGDLAIDFRRIEKGNGWHDVVLVVKGTNGRQEYRTVGVSPFAREQGSIRGKTWFGARPGNQLEVWLEEHLRLGRETMRMKVSKSITMGKTGQPTLAREWSPAERKLIEGWQKSSTPPPPPPAGYQLAGAETKLIGGMPILAGRSGAWHLAEVIDVRQNGRILVKYRDGATLVPRPRSWVAVEEKTLQAGQSNPSQFRASVRVLPGGSAAVPDGLLGVEADTPIVKGTPAKAERGLRWQDVTIVEVHKDGKVRLHWDKLPSNFDEDRPRAGLLITAETLAALKKPDAAEQFAARAEELENPFDKGRRAPRRGFIRSYPIDIPIPKNATRVTEETPLEPGVRLGCAWGRRWHVVTVLDVHDDGTPRIHWEKFSDAWDGDALREHLIIEKRVLAKLNAKAGVAAAKPSAKAASRGGKDAFKVVLKDFGARKVAVTKVVIEATGLDLKDAKEFVEAAPITIKQNLGGDAAKKLRAALQDAGATVTIELQ